MFTYWMSLQSIFALMRLSDKYRISAIKVCAPVMGDYDDELDICGMRRNSIDISIDILNAARGVANKMRIFYGSNLKFEIAKGYLNTLIRSGLLEFDESGRYSTTKNGVKFIRLQRFEKKLQV